MSNDLIPVSPVTTSSLNSFEDCVRAAQALKGRDPIERTAGILTILTRAAEIGLTDLQAETLIDTLYRAIGHDKRMIRKTWLTLKEKADKERAADAAKEAQRRAAEYAAQAQAARDAERDRLWASCSKIAESSELLAAMEAIAHQVLGVVNEGAGVRGAYLAGVSRLLVNEAARVLRTGASASGKNYPVEKALLFFPPHAVVQISGASPKSIPYYGDDGDADALKHKILYVPEAVILAKKAGSVDNEFATMFRTLLSEGRILYQTVATDPATGRKRGETVIKNGPIAAILTTADDVDYQLKTRCLIQGTDESGKQTEQIVERALSDLDETAPNLEPWIDFQLLLEMEAPYRVRIPFKKAVYQAFKQWRPGFLKGANLRMRRDVDSFMSGVKASAVAYKFQRETEGGAIVATLDDYRHSLEAFDEGLAVAHGHVDETVIAVVEAVEEMSGDADLSVKVPVRELCKKLRIASTSTAKERLDEAVSAGALEYDDTMRGGRGSPRYFRVLRSSAELRAGARGGVFPPVEIVKKIFSGGGGKAEQNEQKIEGEAKTRI
jgi:hypothetical protein